MQGTRLLYNFARAPVYAPREPPFNLLLQETTGTQTVVSMAVLVLWGARDFRHPARPRWTEQRHLSVKKAGRVFSAASTAVLMHRGDGRLQ